MRSRSSAACPRSSGPTTAAAGDRAERLFAQLGAQIIRTSSKEAELTKLFTNAWRYMKFAVANQFFMVAHEAGVDYNRVLDAIRTNYPRAADLPGPGFAAGPCLLKDTMQLAAFTTDHFPLGQSAMQINEGLPSYVVNAMEQPVRLAARPDDRPPRDGVQGRVGRHPLEPLVQGAQAPGLEGREGAVHRSVRRRRPPGPARERSWPMRTSSSSAPRTAHTADSRSAGATSSTCGA